MINIKNANSKVVFHDLFFLIVLLLAGLKLTSSLQTVLDIQLYDEANYLFKGVHLFKYGVLEPSWGPLYSIWYFVLSLIEGDKILLFYLNYKLSIILPTLLFYILLRSSGVQILLAIIISFILMISYSFINPFPRISHFTLIIIISSLILFLNSKNKLRAILILLIGLIVGSYARPELFLSFIFLFAYYIYFLIKSRKSIGLKKELFQLLIFLIIPTLLIIFIGLPIFQDGERSFAAFSQHFSFNSVKWNESNINPWINHNYIVKENFGEIKTIFEAFRSNSGIFIKHIFSNILTFLLYLVSIFSLHANVILPGNSMTYAFVEAIVLGCIILFLVFRKIILKKVLLKYEITKSRTLIFITFLIIIPFVGSSILIYPRHHYLLIIGTMLIFIISIVLCSNDSKSTKPTFRKTLLTGIIIILLTPYMRSNTAILPDYKENPDHRLINNEIITFIKSFNIKKQVSFLDAGAGYYVFLPKNFEQATCETNSRETWTDDVASKVNMILINKDLLGSKAISNNPYWQNFYEHYTDFRFRKFAIRKKEGCFLLIHNKLLNTKNH